MQDLINVGSAGVSVGSKAYSAFAYEHANDFEVDKTKANVDQNNPSKVIDADPSDVITKPEQWVKDKGKLGTAVNYLFSPNISKLLTVATIILCFFSPLGIIFGAIAAAVSATMLIYGTYGETKKYRNLKTLQQKRAIVEEVQKIDGHINDICKGNPRLARLFHIISGLNLNRALEEPEATTETTPLLGKSQRSDQGSDTHIKQKPRSIASIVDRVPESAINITGAALTLNPLALGTSVLGATFGTWASNAQRKAYWQKKQDLIHHINGLDADIDRNMNITDMRRVLEARQHQFEIFQKLEEECQKMHRMEHEFSTNQAQYKKNSKEDRQKYKQYMNDPDMYLKGKYSILMSQQPLQRQFDYPHQTSFMQDLGTVLKAGNTWTKQARLYTPMLNTYGNHYHNPNPPQPRTITEPSLEQQLVVKRQRNRHTDLHPQEKRRESKTPYIREPSDHQHSLGAGG